MHDKRLNLIRPKHPNRVLYYPQAGPDKPENNLEYYAGRILNTDSPLPGSEFQDDEMKERYRI